MTERELYWYLMNKHLKNVFQANHHKFKLVVLVLVALYTEWELGSTNSQYNFDVAITTSLEGFLSTYGLFSKSQA